MIQLKVFPNTGHQYFQIEIKKLLPKKDEEWLERFVWTNRGPWQSWDAYTPWIRYQYTMIQGVANVKLAIETNLGMSSRGQLFDVDDTLYDERPEEDSQTLPYASFDEAQIEEDFGQERVMPLQFLPNKDGLDIDIELAVYWPKGDGSDPVDVDLIVDLGNSRTVALLLESPSQEPHLTPFGRRVRILRIMPRGTPYGLTGDFTGSVLQDKCAIIDSWMLLHRPVFCSMDPPFSEEKIFDYWEPESAESSGKRQWRKKLYLPHTFVELSPALIGGGDSPEGASKILAGVSLDHDARFSLSSPKRYVWDEKPMGYDGGTVWKQIPNDTDRIPPDFFDDLNGLIRYFMDPGGVDWDIDSPPDENDFRGMPFISARPTYPRRDAICWFALSMIEAAHRQMNSIEYLRIAGRESLPRRLRSVRVTYPAGWTHEERSKYLGQWQRAINLFTLTRFPNHEAVSLKNSQKGGDRPVLAPQNLDEAVCSQLPILYSDIRTLWGDGFSWFDLYGHEEKTVVMNIDIGGGTTDIAIIEYSPEDLTKGDPKRNKLMGEKASVALQPKLLYRDGLKIAGDMLVKRIIEKALLPLWVDAADEGIYEECPDAKEWLVKLFKAPAHNEFSNVDPKASQKMARIIRLVFIPLVNEWLGRLTESESNKSAWRPLRISDYADPTIVGDLNQLVRKVIRFKTRNGECWRGTPFPLEDIYLKCDRSDLEACIDEVFKDLFSSLSYLVGQFNCQLVIVSGKPSELPRMRTLLIRSFPLLPQRIVQVKNFPAGDWYPFASFDGGRIMDAKTCTVVGAALYQDICNGNLEGFTISEESSLGLSRNYYWGILSKTARPEEFYSKRNLLFSPRDYPVPGRGEEMVFLEKEFDYLPLNCRIGRQITKMSEVRPDPVYMLRWSPEDLNYGKDAYAKVRLRWVSRIGEGEMLELVSVESIEGYPEIDPDDVSLELNTMLEESFWLDDPKFDADEMFAPRRTS